MIDNAQLIYSKQIATSPCKISTSQVATGQPFQLNTIYKTSLLLISKLSSFVSVNTLEYRNDQIVWIWPNNMNKMIFCLKFKKENARIFTSRSGPTRLKPRHKVTELRGFSQIKARPNLTNIGLKLWKLTHTECHTYNTVIHRTHTCKSKDFFIMPVTEVIACISNYTQ